MQEQLLVDKIFKINTSEDFNEVALAVFRYQYKHVSLYRNFCMALNRTKPKHYSEIPFLPISFFKQKEIYSTQHKEIPTLIFKSSGTSQGIRSKHFILEPKLYEYSFLHTFSQQIAPPEETIILALLPNYIEQGDSSLVYMVNSLIKESKHPLSGFYLDNTSQLIAAIDTIKKQHKKIILFGVSFALLDLAEKNIDLSGVIIIETGGMKGRRKEIVREELHQILKEGLNVNKIYSEYGMTELLSQAYTEGENYFTPPKWMKILIRDINDPLSFISDDRTGGVNVIDLANIFSCSFIATDDLGQKKNDTFKILGRFDKSDLRGCNLMVN